MRKSTNDLFRIEAIKSLEKLKNKKSIKQEWNAPRGKFEQNAYILHNPTKLEQKMFFENTGKNVYSMYEHKQIKVRFFFQPVCPFIEY
jgi:hypothetical protein